MGLMQTQTSGSAALRCEEGIQVIKTGFQSIPWILWGFPGGSVKNLPATQQTRVRPLGWQDPPEKEMAAHSSTLAWRLIHGVASGTTVYLTHTQCKGGATEDEVVGWCH